MAQISTNDMCSISIVATILVGFHKPRRDPEIRRFWDFTRIGESALTRLKVSGASRNYVLFLSNWSRQVLVRRCLGRRGDSRLKRWGSASSIRQRHSATGADGGLAPRSGLTSRSGGDASRQGLDHPALWGQAGPRRPGPRSPRCRWSKNCGNDAPRSPSSRE